MHLGVRSSPLGADMVSKSRNMSADMVFMPVLMALMPPTICCVRSQSVYGTLIFVGSVGLYLEYSLKTTYAKGKEHCVCLFLDYRHRIGIFLCVQRIN